jgi:hypothetical protein
MQVDRLRAVRIGQRNIKLDPRRIASITLSSTRTPVAPTSAVMSQRSRNAADSI